jgi:hypothetical protein
MDPELVTNKTMDYITSNPFFLTRYMTPKSTLMFRFSLSPGARENIVKPFLDGKYSKIDRDYVKEHFNKLVSGGSQLSTNWMILNKHESLRKYWEEQIGTTLPQDAEVWSRPEKIDEIYNYETDTTNEQRA